MPSLEDYRNFFNKSLEEKVAIYQEQKLTSLKKDKRIARYLGTDDFQLIATIRDMLHCYDYACQKITREIELTKDKKILIEDSLDET